MAAIELPAHHRRLAKEQRGMASRLAEIRENICEADGVALGPDGKCTVCGRSRVREPEVELEPVHDGEPTEQDVKRGQFWQRYAAETREREQEQATATKREPVAPKTSRAAQAAHRFDARGWVIPDD
jgi:hypothetical protein